MEVVGVVSVEGGESVQETSESTGAADISGIFGSGSTELVAATATGRSGDEGTSPIKIKCTLMSDDFILDFVKFRK